jgi:hypothetical protein
MFGVDAGAATAPMVLFVLYRTAYNVNVLDRRQPASLLSQQAASSWGC